MRSTAKAFCSSIRWGLISAALLALVSAWPASAAESAGTVPLRWGRSVLKQKPDWYATAEARALADSVLQYQSPQGAWPKNTQLASPPRTPEDVPSPTDGRANTIDNEATTLPLQFLARMVDATNDENYRDAFVRGLDYLFDAQYPNGGWPQFYPLRGGYYDHITYNDGAMVRVLTVLREIARGHSPSGFIDVDRRAKAAAAVERGIDCILRTQIEQNGRLTVWCAQHDEKTLEPAWARKYEPPSLSGAESVGVVRFLMQVEQPSPAIVAAIEGAVAWLQSTAIHGIRIERVVNAAGEVDPRIIEDPAAGPLWARFYELGTNRPLFMDRDSQPVFTYGEIGRERRAGYSYYGDWAATLLAKDYPAWRAKQASGVSDQ